MNCAACGHMNPERVKFCLECGKPVATRCARCGRDLPPAAKFCGECGAEVQGSGVGSQVSGPNTQHPTPVPHSEGERRQLTVLFCDLVGSTPLSQQLDAEEWRDIIAQYQQAAAAAVERFGGHVAKKLGDGLLVYFGWPTAREDDPERAIRAGLAIIDGAWVPLNAKVRCRATGTQRWPCASACTPGRS